MRLLPLLLLMPSLASAVPITYEFSGYLTHSQFPPTDTAPVDVGVTAGDPFTGRITYDPSAFTCYEVASSVCRDETRSSTYWEVSFGAFTLSATVLDILVSDDGMMFAFGRNEFSPQIYEEHRVLAQSDTYFTVSGSTLGTSLRDLGGLPTDLLAFTSIGWFENAFLQHISQHADGDRWDVGGVVTQITKVPEPATGLLLGIGLIGIISMRRARVPRQLVN